MKTADRIFVKILLWTVKNLLNFGSYPHLDSNQVIFFKESFLKISRFLKDSSNL